MLRRAASTRSGRAGGRLTGCSRGGNDRWSGGREERALLAPTGFLTCVSDCRTIRHMGVYDALGVRRVINASGIYTDLGGSCLSPAVWAAAAEANRTWA